MVCHCGSLVLDEAGRPLAGWMLGAQTAARLLRFTHGHPLAGCRSLYRYNEWYCDNTADPYAQLESRETGMKPQQSSLPALAESLGEVHKLTFKGAPAGMARLEAELQGAFPGLSIFRSTPWHLEVVHGAGGKDKAMREYCRLRGLDIGRSIAFGDSFSDAPMLRAAGQGVAMANAPAEVQAAADHVAQANSQEGLRLFLEAQFGT